RLRRGRRANVAGRPCLWRGLPVVYRSRAVFRVRRSAAHQHRAAGCRAQRRCGGDVRTEVGERVYGWWKAPLPGHGVILVLCGKGVIVSDTAALFGDLTGQDFGVLAIDYRGNGVSTGIPTEAGLRADARAGFDFVRAAAPQAKIA